MPMPTVHSGAAGRLNPAELDAMAILRAQGYRVVVSRTQDTTVTRLTPAMSMAPC